MVYTPHQVNKIEKIVALTAGIMVDDLVLPQLVTHETVDQFKGAAGDKITKTVEGRLPYREYAFRNDRSEGIIFDVYKEGKTDITWGGRIYSGVELTDEQHDFDLPGWNKLAAKQAQAVAQGVNDRTASAIRNAPYNYTVGLGGADAPGDIKAALFELRKLMNKLRVRGERFLAVGSDVEQAILLDEKLTMTDAVSQGRAESALANAAIGKIAGFTIISDLTLPADEAYAFVPDAFVLLSGIPVIPQSAPFATTISHEGYGFRWIKDYDQKFFVDRSSVDLYTGVNHVEDFYLKKPEKATGSAPVTLEPSDVKAFIRGVKFSLTDDSSFGAQAASLQADTGIDPTKGFVAPSLRTVTP